MVKKIPSDASPEKRDRIIEIRRKAFSDLKSIRNEKSDEIVLMLDLFNGALTLNDILDTDISILKALELAKRRLLIRANEEREKRNNQLGVKSANAKNVRSSKRLTALESAKNIQNALNKKIKD